MEAHLFIFKLMTRTRPNLSQFRSFKISCKKFLNYTKCADLLIVMF